MSVIRKLNVSPTAQWWIDIRPLVDIFTERIQESPMLTFENASEIAKQLQKIYTQVQQMPCPAEADELFTYLTRALLNLFMCYQSVADFQWDKAEVFYGRATSDWTRTKGLLSENGLRRVAV